MSDENKTEFLIIGGGAAGFSAAIVANGLGRKTIMINAGLPLGGTCVNVGCVPTKHLLEIAKQMAESRESRFAGLTLRPAELDLAKVTEAKDELVAGLRAKKYTDVLAALENVSLIEGQARFVDANQVEVNGQRIRFERAIITTGSRTRVLPIPGLAEAPFLTNETVLALRELPEHLVVLGGGAIAVEFAYMFRAFGSRVTMVQRSKRILSKYDPEVSIEMRKNLREMGIDILTGCDFQKIETSPGSITVVVERNSDQARIEGSHLLVATGVAVNVENLDLQAAGIELDADGVIRVGDDMRTTNQAVAAAGDVIGRMQLETTAAREGNFAARNLLEGTELSIDYSVVPEAVFSDPQVAKVGISEEELMERTGVCACRTLAMARVPKAEAILDPRGLIKMVIDPTDGDRVVGVEIVSPLAADMIHEATLIIQQGMTVDDVINTTHVFPTMSEAIKMVAMSFDADLDKLSCCTI